MYVPCSLSKLALGTNVAVVLETESVDNPKIDTRLRTDYNYRPPCIDKSR
jgi:hypothetical protein